ncbi:MAG: aminoglycoside phosphotransferase family protein [Alphaproteobacteria bacterium]
MKLNLEIEENLQEENILYEKLFFLAGDASPRKYFIIKQQKKENILMYDNDSSNLQRFIFLTNHLNGYASIPKIIYNLSHRGILILENFKNKFSQIINSNNKKKIYDVALDSLIFIHKSNFNIRLPYYNINEYLKESNLFFDWFVENQRTFDLMEIKQEFNEIFKDYLKRTSKLPKVFIHRDYHVDNLFYLNKRKNHLKCGWIDYQDAVIGPCVYDIVSLAQDARIDVDKSIEKELIRKYLKNFKAIDIDLFMDSYNLIAIQRHLKVLGIFSRLAKRDNKKNYLRYLPRVLKLLNNNLEKNEYRSFSKIIKQFISE